MTTPTVTTPSAPMKMGPGLLSFGATGGAVDVSSIVTKCATKWKADADDDTVTLSGAVIAGERKYSCQLAFTAYQDDMSTGGLIDVQLVPQGADGAVHVHPAKRRPVDQWRRRRGPGRRRRGHEQQKHVRRDVGLRR
jgi:hypothetical protein